ncbi:MAG: ornithine carbamoyltransferase [Thermoguttaceae bacterium]
MRHLVTLSDLTSVEIERIFAITEDLKSKYEKGLREPLLPGRVMALIFEKPSLRTRVSFEACMLHLGGGAMFLGEDVGFGKRESLADFARVLSELVDVVVVRAKHHQTVVDLAAHCTCPVINGLTDLSHPCQAMADLYTLREIFGSLRGRTLAWIGDGNNVARSLATGCGKVGMRFVLAAPEGYEFDDDFVRHLAEDVPELDMVVTRDPAEAVADACAIYTDVWVSMGQEAEMKQRQKAFAAYQVNSELMSKSPADAVFMHCLPARRGEEVTDEVMDSPASVIVRQAGNRMHAQKGILAWLLGTQAQ